MTPKHKRSAMLAVAVVAIVAGAIVAGVTAGGNGHGTPSARTLASRRSARGRKVRSAGAPSETGAEAGYLGVTQTQLRGELQTGRTLAQIAKATPGKSAAGLVDALVSARAKQLSAAVGAGRLPAAQEKRRLARLRKRIEDRIDRPPGYVGLPATARYLGISTARLRAELDSGHSLAEIAGARAGKSATGLIDARVSAREAALKAALASGRITHATEKALLSSVRRQVTSEVERTPGS
jgi:hypothetical protein